MDDALRRHFGVILESYPSCEPLLRRHRWIDKPRLERQGFEHDSRHRGHDRDGLGHPRHWITRLASGPTKEGIAKNVFVVGCDVAQRLRNQWGLIEVSRYPRSSLVTTLIVPSSAHAERATRKAAKSVVPAQSTIRRSFVLPSRSTSSAAMAMTVARPSTRIVDENVRHSV